jgi:hypothetical protein
MNTSIPVPFSMNLSIDGDSLQEMEKMGAPVDDSASEEGDIRPDRTSPICPFPGPALTWQTDPFRQINPCILSSMI